MPVLKPGATVLARQISTGKIRIAVLEGRNGCRPHEWYAHFQDKCGKSHLMIVVPEALHAVQTECGFQSILPGIE